MREGDRRKAWVTDMLAWHPHWSPKDRERAFFLMPDKVDVVCGKLSKESYTLRMTAYVAYVIVPNRPPLPRGTKWVNDALHIPE